MAKDLDKNEWYFEECPADELEYCWTYEYARESEYLRTIITMWRKGAKGSKIENYIEVEEELGAETSDASVYPFFPCWPDKPYLSINPKTRKEWLRRLGMPLLESAVTGEPPLWNPGALLGQGIDPKATRTICRGKVSLI